MSDCPLTARQLLLLSLVAKGMPLKTVAHHLGISEHTAKNVMWAVHQRLGTQTQAHAVYLALKNGWIR